MTQISEYKGIIEGSHERSQNFPKKSGEKSFVTAGETECSLANIAEELSTLLERNIGFLDLKYTARFKGVLL